MTPETTPIEDLNEEGTQEEMIVAALGFLAPFGCQDSVSICQKYEDCYRNDGPCVFCFSLTIEDAKRPIDAILQDLDNHRRGH